MRTIFLVAIAVVLLAPAGILLAQQKFPNLEIPVVFENDHVVVQKQELKAGEWAGKHSHSGKQMGVVLEGGDVTYKEGEKETTKSYKPGDVIWVDAVEHDHKALSDGKIILITIK